MSFDGPVYLTVQDDGVSFALAEEAVYNGSQGDYWVLPKGFSTDFASIPAVVSWAIPKLGAYSLAALVHDLLCGGLNAFYRATSGCGGAWLAYQLRHASGGHITVNGRRIPIPTASAVDTDAIFRKIAKSYGTDRVTATLLWVGVRWGALANPARRAGWLRTAPAVLGWSLLFSPVLVPATVLAVVGRAVLWLVRRVTR